LCIVTYACEKHHHHENYHNLNYSISLIKIYSIKFYIWKLTKTKSLNPMSKKGHLDCEYALKLQITSIKEPKHSSLDYPWFFTKCFLENSTFNFKTPSIKYLSHIVYQIKLLNIVKKYFQIWKKIQLMMYQIKTCRTMCFFPCWQHTHCIGT